ncbi:uncharacterized protein EDB93DRAFT_1078407, partial [Suillus bovinus]|uniref:uncharacterized protein n=1 Tax=Suillus bovinus TaxID=48563 RepID=UPI001B88088E
VKHQHKYHIRWPNALWHLDGHHKVIQWGIVIHGFIDGVKSKSLLGSAEMVLSRQQYLGKSSTRPSLLYL